MRNNYLDVLDDLGSCLRDFKTDVLINDLVSGDYVSGYDPQDVQLVRERTALFLCQYVKDFGVCIDVLTDRLRDIPQPTGEVSLVEFVK